MEIITYVISGALQHRDSMGNTAVMRAGDVQRIAQAFFDPKQIALTILGNLDGFKIGREDLVC